MKVPSLPDVPGMITEAEGRYLYWLTSRAYTGKGAVVEVGSWLGRSTLHLAAGLNDAGFHDALHCFDQFLWRHSHGLKSALGLKTGENFQPFFERNVRPVYPSVRVTRTTMRDLVWDGGPIEILFLDAPKSLGDLSSVLAAFGPSLVPGLSLIVFQDYQHFPSFPVPAVVSRLQEHLEILHIIEAGSSVSFAVKKVMSFDLAQPVGLNFARWTREDASAAWRRILAPLPPGAQARVAPGLAILLYSSHGRSVACEVLREMRLDDEMLAAWQQFAAFPFYDQYRPLFRVVGVRPLRGQSRTFAHLRWTLRQVRARLVRPLRRHLREWARAAAQAIVRTL